MSVRDWFALSCWTVWCLLGCGGHTEPVAEVHDAVAVPAIQRDQGGPSAMVSDIKSADGLEHSGSDAEGLELPVLEDLGPSVDAGEFADPDVSWPMDSEADIDGNPQDGSASTQPPDYPHLDLLVDTFRGNISTWLHFIHVDLSETTPSFHHVGYADTSDGVGYWPASTIKIYTATAALVLLAAEGFSLDATAEFYHRSGEQWVYDTSQTFREMVFDTFNCSSNSAYTLLLRFAGVDWLNQEFFTPAQGFENTTLMSGYVNGRPYTYRRDEAQRIVVTEGAESWERVHSFSGTPYWEQVGCTVSYGSAANCSSTRDMAEHMRRVMFHEHLSDEARFPVAQEALDWMRYGAELPVMNNKQSCGGPGWAGVSRVFPEAEFFHKGGAVSAYRLDLQYIQDAASEVAYIVAIATESGQSTLVEKLSEEVARMAATPTAYVHLDTLEDGVNPVVADLTVYSETEATLELVALVGEGEPEDPMAIWEPVAGTATVVPAGVSAHTLVSNCLENSGKRYVRGRLSQGELIATSDLHYVIVDADIPCP